MQILFQDETRYNGVRATNLDTKDWSSCNRSETSLKYEVAADFSRQLLSQAWQKSTKKYH